MRRPFLALTAVMLASSALAPLHVAAAAQHPRAVNDTVRLTAAHWLADQRRALRAAGGTVVESPDAAAAGTYNLEEFAYLVPAGKLKGSNQDVLDIRRIGLPGSGHPLGVTARVGATGNVLWQHSLSQPAHTSVGITPEPVGPHAKPGVLADKTTASASATGIETLTQTLTAYDGATGKQLWSKTFTGTENNNTGAMTDVPDYVGPQAQARGGPSFLMEIESSAGSTDTASLTEISGSDGAFSELGSPVSAPSTAPSFTVVPDVNRDAVADIAVSVSSGTTPFVRLWSGASGQTLWTANGVDPFGFDAVESIGHFSSKTHIDLAVNVITTTSTKIDIVSGTTGKLVWSRTAGQVNVIREAGKHMQPAVQLVTFTSPTATKLTAVGRFVAVTPANKVLYDKKVSVSEPYVSHANDNQTGGSALVAGDVQGDGSLDKLLSLSASSANTKKTVTTTKTGILDGRTGTFRELNAGTAADGSLRKGSHTDFLAVAAKAGHAKLSGWVGASRKPYYLDKSISGVTGVKAAWVQVGRVSGHTCSDVLLSAASPNSGFVGVLDGDGQPLWLVKHTAAQATGGHLTTFNRPTTFCAS